MLARCAAAVSCRHIKVTRWARFVARSHREALAGQLIEVEVGLALSSSCTALFLTCLLWLNCRSKHDVSHTIVDGLLLVILVCPGWVKGINNSGIDALTPGEGRELLTLVSTQSLALPSCKALACQLIPEEAWSAAVRTFVFNRADSQPVLPIFHSLVKRCRYLKRGGPVRIIRVPNLRPLHASAT